MRYHGWMRTTAHCLIAISVGFALSMVFSIYLIAGIQALIIIVMCSAYCFHGRGRR